MIIFSHFLFSTMRILLFDTETNGLPKRFNASVFDVANWPFIISIAWQIWEVVADSDPLQTAHGEQMITPGPLCVWDVNAEKIHGISMDRASREGKPGHEFFPEFQTIVKSADVIVAHNMQFDKSVLLSEFIRINPNLRMDWWPRFEYCTCINTIELCKLVSTYDASKLKRPKLVELYEFLFEKKADFAFHTASGDVDCMVQCFFELLRRRVVPIDLWECSLRV